MAAALGSAYRVVEEALVGRTTMVDPPFVDGRSARAVLPILLESHMPLDAVIVLLGANDLQPILGLDARQIAWGCGGLLRTITLSRFGPDGAAPKALLVTPPRFGRLQGAAAVSFAGREAESARLHPAYAPVAALFGAAAFDANTVCQASAVDGLHPDPAGLHALGLALAQQVRALLAP
jgi:lysophospholipase L1-like esterase